MSQESLSGPQIVSTRAQEIIECPHLNGEKEAFWDDFEPVDLSFQNPIRPTGASLERERVNRFALAKYITDELANRLPHMVEKYPPYGLPEMYRLNRMSSPGWRPIPELVADPETDTHLQGMLSSLNDAYGSKAIIHFYDELKDMHQDPKFKDAVQAMSVQRTPNYHINTRTADGEAATRLLQPVENAQDTILGLFHVLPAVFQEKFGHSPSHEEAIAILQNSKRLSILPSLLSMRQLQAYIIGSTEAPHMPAARYGYIFKPALFTINEAKNGNSGPVMDYSNGVGSIAVQKYTLDHGDEGAAYIPEIIIDETAPADKLEELKPDRTTLTCPARKFIVAMWADMLDISDRARIFDQ